MTSSAANVPPASAPVAPLAPVVPAPASAPTRHLYYATAFNAGPAGASETRFVELEGVAKLAGGGSGPFTVVNELVAYRIAVALGLPVPPGALIHVPAAHMPPLATGSAADGVAWLALSFQPRLISKPPIDPAIALAEHPTLCPGVLAFDLLLANTDRHSGNLGLENGPVLPVNGLPQSRLEIFDHSHALIGDGQPTVKDRLAIMRGKFVVDGLTVGGNRHCLLHVLDDLAQLRSWTARVRLTVTDRVIEAACEEGTMLGSPLTASEALELSVWLKERRDTLDELLNDGRANLPSIAAASWPVSP